MTAQEIWQYCVPYISALSPVVLLVGVVAVARLLVAFIRDLMDY